MDIWAVSHAKESISRLNTQVWRVVEDQVISSTRQLVNSLEEHEILEQEIEHHKPSIRQDCTGFDYLLFTPFRYPPLQYGSRFGNKTEPSLWYGSLELMTALAESAYYRFVFILGSQMKEGTDKITKTAFSANVDTTKGLDFTTDPFVSYRESISSPTTWQLSQMLGTKMREAGIQAFKYFSSRDTSNEGTNMGVFSCVAFSNKKPLNYRNFVEFCNRSSVEFIDKANQDKYVFKIEDFMVDHDFPFPPK